MLCDARNRLSLPADTPDEMAAILHAIRTNIDGNPGLALHHLDRLSAALDLGRAVDPIARALLPAHAALFKGHRTGGLAGWQLNRVTAYIERHIETPLTTERLAASIHVSTGHFCRAFKVAMGETPHSYVIRQRLRRAQTLMLRTDDTLSQIAFAAGLTDQAHLTRLFRRIVGTTPMAWRRAWQSVCPPGDPARKRREHPNAVTSGQDIIAA